jgi:hypothetical protein
VAEQRDEEDTQARLLANTRSGSAETLQAITTPSGLIPLPLISLAEDRAVISP